MIESFFLNDNNIRNLKKFPILAKSCCKEFSIRLYELTVVQMYCILMSLLFCSS